MLACQTVGPSGMVYSADINSLAIKKVVKKAQKNNLNNIKTVKTDCKTDLDDNSIEIILCFDVLYTIEEHDRILKEFHRVLKSNGIFSFDDHYYSEAEIESLIITNGLFELVEKKEKQYNFTKN